MQAEAAAAAEYWPAAHGAQELEPPSEDLPATQAVHALLSSPENLPAAQLEQPAEVPALAWYDPAPHLMFAINTSAQFSLSFEKRERARQL